MTRTPQERQRSVHDRAVEFQMRLQEVLQRVADETTHASEARALGPFVTLSRQTGSGGAEVARRLGARLGWTVLDRELVERLARRMSVGPEMVKLMDETHSNWLSDTLYSLVDSRLSIEDAFVRSLARVLVLAATQEPVIVVGRGANWVLPPEAGVRVRVVAPAEQRRSRLAAAAGIDEKAAEKTMRGMDESRSEYVRRHFHCSVDDPSGYDMVLDSSSFGLDGSVDLICRALALRGFTGISGRAAAG